VYYFNFNLLYYQVAILFTRLLCPLLVSIDYKTKPHNVSFSLMSVKLKLSLYGFILKLVFVQYHIK